MRRSGTPLSARESLGFRWGSHLCLFYSGTTQLHRFAATYFDAGLESDARCLWITAAAMTQKQVQSALSQFPSAKTLLRTEQLRVIPYSEWYLRGGRFDSDHALAFASGQMEEAQRDGFCGLRVLGDFGWLRTPEQRRAFVEYERLVTRHIDQARLVGLCAYPAASWAPEAMLDVMQSHHSLVLPASRGWKQCEML
jgi:hypothetical protein